MKQLTTGRVLLILLTITYLIVGALYAARTPDWQAPDEPAHYNYVAQISANGCCPVIEMGDWDSAYLDAIKAARFAPETLGALDSVQYEDHQPPLYYLLASVVFRLAGGSLLALRLLSVLIGAGVVIGAYATAKALLPEQTPVALATAALVAFIPQHMAMLAAVNNDGLAELIVALTLWGAVVTVKGGRVQAWQLGVLVGLGLVTKISTVFLVGIVPLAIVAKWWVMRNTIGARDAARAQRTAPLRQLVLFALPVLVIGGVWWARNVSVYGFPDAFGLGAHNRVVVGQLRTADYLAELGAGDYLRQAAQITFESFWGKFGWMDFALPNWAYGAILAMMGAAVAGWVMRLTRHRADKHAGLPRQDGAAWLIMAAAGALAALQYVYYNTEFVQFQGRYMYPGLIPFGLFVALGLDEWRRLVSGRARWFALAVIALLIPLNVYVVWRIVPGLAG